MKTWIGAARHDHATDPMVRTDSGARAGATNAGQCWDQPADLGCALNTRERAEWQNVVLITQTAVTNARAFDHQ